MTEIEKQLTLNKKEDRIILIKTEWEEQVQISTNLVCFYNMIKLIVRMFKTNWDLTHQFTQKWDLNHKQIFIRAKKMV